MIDNYDSFTFNLVQYLSVLDQEVVTVRNDEFSVDELIRKKYDRYVISPGPSTPDQAGISLELIAKLATQKIPLLGVCLGHQAIGQHFGAKLSRLKDPVHGKVSSISHTNSNLFANVSNPFVATRYHSLYLETIPKELEVTATSNDGVVMALKHKHLPIFGVQFHPESILTKEGLQILRNFVNL